MRWWGSHQLASKTCVKIYGYILSNNFEVFCNGNLLGLILEALYTAADLFSLYCEVLLVSPLSFQPYQQGSIYTKELCCWQYRNFGWPTMEPYTSMLTSRWWFLRKDRLVNKRVSHLFSIKGRTSSSHLPYYLFVSTFIFCSILKWYLWIYSNYILSAYFSIWLKRFC